MAEDKYVRMAHAIYNHVGGPQNVLKLIHCTTRVRLTIRDESIVAIDGLKAIDGVLGVVQEETLQVVVGPGAVDKVAAEMLKEVGVGLGEPFPAPKAVVERSSQSTHLTNKEKVETKAKQVHTAQQVKIKQSSMQKFASAISSIFVPLIPVFCIYLKKYTNQYCFLLKQTTPKNNTMNFHRVLLSNSHNITFLIQRI